MTHHRIETSHTPHPLGRHVNHDPLSRRPEFHAVMAPAEVVRTVSWRRYGHAFDQGSLGSCTGNAAAAMLMTKPFWRSGRHLTERSAVKFYTYATIHDPFDGAYPPTDTGSDGNSVMLALRNYGYVKKWTHAFGMDEVIRALQIACGITGVNWYSGMDEPDSEGIVKVSGWVRGGHEFLVSGVNLERELLECWNSWGLWGLQGRFFIPLEGYDRLLMEEGDYTTAEVYHA